MVVQDQLLTHCKALASDPALPGLSAAQQVSLILWGKLLYVPFLLVLLGSKLPSYKVLAVPWGPDTKNLGQAESCGCEPSVDNLHISRRKENNDPM